jgi:hypothetical protein
MDMSKWKTMSVDVVDGVLLDPTNVRLSIESVDVPQADIIHDLFKNEATLGLVEGIAKIGYLTHEIPIVLRRKRKLYAVEGNRRLAALKAIQNPHLAGDYQSRVSALCESIADRDQLRSIEVKVAPSEADALQLVAALHTGNLRRPWKPERQAKFFQAQLDAGVSIRELRRRYPTVDLTKFVLRSRIVDFFRKAKYDDDSLSSFVASSKFSVSTLARLYESKPFQALTGVGLTDDEDAKLSLGVSDECFRRMAEHIATGMRAGEIDTRSVGTVKSPRFKTLMTELEAIKIAEESFAGEPPTGDGSTAPTAGAPGTSTSDSEGGSPGAATPGATPPEPPTAATPAKKPPPDKYLKVSSIEVPDSFPPAVQQVINEISRLDITQFPNAVFDLMRTLLEKSIKSYAESVGDDIQRSGKNKDGFVFLKQCLEWLEEHYKTTDNRGLMQVVKKIRSNKVSDFAGSHEHLNAINHNHKIAATADDVRNGWTAILPLLAGMMPA